MSFFKSIWDDFKYSLRAGSMVTKLVVVNFAVFFLANLAYVILAIAYLGGNIETLYWDAIDSLSISSNWRVLIWHPWTIFTHFFLHVDVWHLFNNLMGLYLFGAILTDLVGDRRIFPIYLLGGLAGAVFFFISANITPVGLTALGASAAVMALAGACITLAPDYRLPLLLLGEVKVKYIVLVFVLLDMVAIARKDVNSGGHTAHIGGFLMGIFFIYRLRDGKDMSEPINRLLNWLTNLFTRAPRLTKASAPKRKIKTAIRATMSNTGGSASSDRNDLSHQERLDAILEKIKDSGYENLSQAEKDFLYDASKK